jgi:predicted AlkP superfamily phosphohydrolase/phosphomutase/tetratricopeptide (TPR) repeat protein
MNTALAPLARKVLLIGWDAADWRVIDPLLQEGKMPNLARFLERGVRGNISTLYPAYSPMLWTSIATGKRPYKHGILGFSEPTPDGRAVRPITNLSRTTKAVWNILSQVGKTSNVVGWWPSHPAEPIRGVMVSNHYQRAERPADRPWPMAPGTVHPERLASALAEFRIHPAELGHEDIGPFVPRFGEIDQDADQRLESLARVVADVAGIHAAATALMQLEPWDFMGVYFDGIDHLSHGFMRYHPPKQGWVDQRDFELYSGVIEGAYRFHDMMLGALLALAGEETTVILMSDHGFHPDRHRPRDIPTDPAGPAIEHRHYGILAMKGPGIRRGERIFGSSILDVCPTVLRLFGLPAGADMDGKVLTTAFEEPPEVATIPSWDEVPGDDGRHAAGLELDPVAAAESMRQLVDLGYIEPLPEDAEAAVRQTVRELRFNLAQSYIDGRRFADAVAILEPLWAEWPSEHRLGVALAHCLASLRKVSRRREVLDRLQANIEEQARLALAKLEQFRGADGKLSLDELKPAVRHSVRRLLSLASPRRGRMHYLRGLQQLLEGRPDQALIELERGAGREGLSADVQVQLGRGFLALQRPEQAEARFRAALELDAEDVAALIGLAEARDAQHDYEASLEAALAAAELIFLNPRAHALVGTALLHLGQYDEAERALKLALHQNPGERRALRGLTHLYRDLRPDPIQAILHERRIADLREKIRARRKARTDRADQAEAAPRPDPTPVPAAEVPADRVVTVVSGLPRSGTSMMMQVLAAGGIPPYTDHRRPADLDNPRGYLEHEHATRLASDNRWLPEARGLAVKVVAPLLHRLPETEHYRVILMRRDLDEVVSSQRAMLDRLGRPGASLADDVLKSALARQLEQADRWAGRHPNVRLLSLDYAEVLADPEAACLRVREFLGLPLDAEAMRAAIDPSLRRWRRDAAAAGGAR